MAFSPDDRNWLDQKFDKVHDRLTDSDKNNARLLNEQSVNLTAQIVQSKDHARELIEKHEAKKHDLGKLISMIAGISAVVGAIIGAIIWIVKHAPNG